MQLQWIMMVIFLFTLIAPAFGQQSAGISGKSIVELRQEEERAVLSSFRETAYRPFLPKFLSNTAQPAPLRLSRMLKREFTAPSVYAYDELGLFCKFEVQLERFAKFPIKLRLGDVPYVDRLEGKREF